MQGGLVLSLRMQQVTNASVMIAIIAERDTRILFRRSPEG